MIKKYGDFAASAANIVRLPHDCYSNGRSFPANFAGFGGTNGSLERMIPWSIAFPRHQVTRFVCCPMLFCAPVHKVAPHQD
jgi:hypothetical protein